MGTLKDIKAELEIRKQKMDEAIEKLSKVILDLPDNDKITRLGLSASPKCYILNFKDLSVNNFSPEYYDFKEQYKKLVEELNKKETIEGKFSLIETILKTSKMRLGTYTYVFNPTVVKYLKEIV